MKEQRSRAADPKRRAVTDAIVWGFVMFAVFTALDAWSDHGITVAKMLINLVSLSIASAVLACWKYRRNNRS